MFSSIINRIQNNLSNKSTKADLVITAESAKNYLSAATHKLLKIQEENEKEEKQLESYLSTLLRFMPIETVDNLAAVFSEKNASQGSIYQQAKKHFFAVAPYFSRYTDLSNLKDLGDVYSRRSYIRNARMPKNDFIKYVTENDMKYGESRRNKAIELYNSLVKDKRLAPKNRDYYGLPPSPKGTRRAAALLENISEFIFSDTEAASNYYQKSLRPTGEQWSTPITRRYAFALPIIKKVYALSKAPDINKKSPTSYEMFYIKDKNKKILMNETVCPIDILQVRRWYHGKAELRETWSLIEDKFEKLWDMEIKQPLDKTNPTEQETYKKQLTQFYSEVAELLWLSGNTQPLKRGSGSYAELLLAILHLKHNLQPPILKLEFPQLDVLNISIPLSDYKKMFTYFFEPCTIPEHLRFNIPSSLSVENQLEALYKKINLTPIFPKVIFHGEIEAFKFIAKQPNKSKCALTTDNDEEPKLPQRVRMRH